MTKKLNHQAVLKIQITEYSSCYTRVKAVTPTNKGQLKKP